MIYGLACAAFIVWWCAVEHLNIWRQWHHEWIGVLLMLTPFSWVRWIGLLIMVDDAAQHWVQCFRPDYRSPLHLAYRYTLYRWFYGA